MPMAAVEGPGYIVRYVNPAFCLLAGKSEEQLIGKAFSAVVPAGDEYLSLLDRVYRTGQAETHTGQERAASHLFYWSYAMWPVMAADGCPAGILIQVTEGTSVHRQATAMNQALMLGSVRQHELTEAVEEALAKRTRLAALAADIGLALTQTADSREALQRCAEAITVHLDAAFARIWTLNAGTNVLELQASAGMYTHLDGPHARVPVGRLKIGLIAQERRAHLTNDVANDPLVSDHKWAEREGMVAFAGFPLIVGGRLAGVMAMFARRPLESEDLDALGSVANGIAIAIERKRAEEATREREERLHIALAASDTGTFRWNPHTGVFLEFDENLKRLFGMTPDEQVRVAEDFIARVHPDDVAALIPAVDRARRGADFEMIFRVIHPDGAIRWLYDRGKTERDIHGNPLYLVGACTDITHRKQSDEALRASAERLLFMSESMPQKIFTAKTNGDVDYLNQQWMEFTGLSFEKIKNWGWTQFIHPNDLEENVRVWRHAVDTGEPVQLVHRFRRHDGVYRWHLSRAHAMRDTAGKISMWTGSSTDIQEEKETEEELRRANEDLNQFAFAASHDLQEPLRMITSYSQLLIKRSGTQLDADTSLYMDYITEGTRHMTELLADLLSYTQAGTDRDKPGGPIDLNVIYHKAARNLQVAIAESGAVITCDHLPVVHGREAHFLQLLQNLIGNAIKYRAERPLSIAISAEKQNGEWRFAVADNGMGIAPEYQQQIFGVFKRLHGKEIPGTGIGLAICQRVVERYGGRIWVESEPDRGATFYFTLPMDSV